MASTATTITLVKSHHLNPNRIVNMNSLHFITLSLLFLPLTFSIMQLHLTTSFNLTTILRNILTFRTLITIISTLTGIALTIYSTHQAILRKPLTFTSTFKSLSHSFMPLLTTFIVATLLLTFLSLIIFITLGPVFHFSSVTISRVIAFTILHYLVIWGLAPAIAVLEFKSGLETIPESVKLSGCFPFMVFGIAVWFWNYVVLMNMESVSSWLLFVKMFAHCLQSAFMFVICVVRSTGVYVEAKAARGEGDVIVRNGMEVTDEDDWVVLHGGFIYVMTSFHVILITSIVIGMF